MSELEQAFDSLVGALATGDLDGFYGLIEPDAVIMDEDLPFRVDRAGFQDHISFHGPENWEGFAWKPQQMRFREHGDTGVAVGFSMFRGKPKDAGFRLRPMMFSQSWTKTEGGWRVTSWHQSPIVGHVSEQSPG
ncbi:YybH family protein [Erythrobacter rubeus]|uniref:Nuclear transport factor 2 family protein n=1 Tax=Erythrobacter rubeus TaxID=2760803 RepID=A0ABR8KTC9_9SPHN|nr:nuclear transport factor 2 family protein [Erythrobacter rubeus]MBD2842615.1 nuclear transport factor 2 family protein [Erythrobacter rubeus]